MTGTPRPRHCLSDIDEEHLTATCSVCGPRSELAWRSEKWRCARGLRESRRRSDQKSRDRDPEKYREQMRDWQRRNVEHRRNYHFQKKYGITIEDYERILAEQGGVCGLCGGPPAGPGSKGGRFHVDHCHDTGNVRGLLCGRCNTAIGLLKHDRALILAAADWV